MCSSRKYPYSPQSSWGVGDSVKPKFLKKYVKLNWNFQRGGEEVLEKNPFSGGYRYFLELHNDSNILHSKNT